MQNKSKVKVMNLHNPSTPNPAQSATRTPNKAQTALPAASRPQQGLKTSQTGASGYNIKPNQGFRKVNPKARSSLRRSIQIPQFTDRIGQMLQSGLQPQEAILGLGGDLTGQNPSQGFHGQAQRLRSVSVSSSEFLAKRAMGSALAPTFQFADSNLARIAKRIKMMQFNSPLVNPVLQPCEIKVKNFQNMPKRNFNFDALILGIQANINENKLKVANEPQNQLQNASISALNEHFRNQCQSSDSSQNGETSDADSGNSSGRGGGKQRKILRSLTKAEKNETHEIDENEDKRDEKTGMTDKELAARLQESVSKRDIMFKTSGSRSFYVKITEDEANQILEFANRNGVTKAAKTFGISKKRINRWIRRGGAKRVEGCGRKTLDPSMEDEVKKWITQYVNMNKKYPKTRMIKNVALSCSSFEGFKASKGWFDKFSNRHKPFLQKMKARVQELNLRGATEEPKKG